MASASEDDLMENGSLEDDLFGSEDEEEQPKPRELSDEELDSGDDEGRSDREPERTEAPEPSSGRNARILDASIWRHALPKPADGEFNSLRLPKFLGIDPLPFDPNTFELPTTDHHSSTKGQHFSASATALSTIRYRRNASTSKLESNTVLHKWSDGSTTLSVGDQHYELQTKPLAPPRDNKTYLEVQDAHQYVASPSISSQLLLMVGHMANQYTVRPNKNIEDDALDTLKKNMAAATRGGSKGNEKGPQVIANAEDPELQKKRAELAEKERMKAQRRREVAAEKANISSSSRRMGGGLSVDDLEGRGRRAPSGRKPSGPKRPRHRRDYSSEEEEGRRGGREDKYDEDDGFLVGSDEEVEEDVEDSDEEEEEEEELPRSKKQKHSQPEVTSDDDAPADLEDIDAPVANEPAGGARGRKRNIIEDDEDD
ncbi:Leo1-like protein-domain-containing protein, partial [Bisporella sp. PMI_857]